MRCNGWELRHVSRRFAVLGLVPRKSAVVVDVVRVVGSRPGRSSCAVRTEPRARRAVIDSWFLRLVLWYPDEKKLRVRTESLKSQ